MLNSLYRQPRAKRRKKPKRLLVLVLRPFRFVSWDLSCSPARSRLQLTDLAFQFCDLLLLLFYRIEHSPEDRIVVNHQVAIGVFGHGFWNDLLQRLRSKADMFSLRLKAQSVVWLVFVAERLQSHDRTESTIDRKSTRLNSSH